MHFEQQTIDEILQKSSLSETIREFIPLKKKGSQLTGNCPNCGRDKFNLAEAKNLYKCFSCETSGNSSVTFLMQTQKMTYVQALQWLAAKFNVFIPEEKPKFDKKSPATPRNRSFRDSQLKSSGISETQQRHAINTNNSHGDKIEIDRYEAASVDQMWNVIPGDDMVLHYMDLDGEPMTYYPPKKSVAKALIRVRHQFPELHKDKSGKGMKYRSPYGSGSALWIPSIFIAWYQTTKRALKNEVDAPKSYETLFITEGEKKADKMCAHGFPTVGLMGINNLSMNGEMPTQIQQIVKVMGFKNVVFVLDADWNNLSLSEDKPVDARPNMFFRAVSKFRDYFYALNNSKIHLEVFFAYHIPVKADEKGMDDFLQGSYKGKEEKLLEEFNKALVAADGKEGAIQSFKITTLSEYKIKEFFHIHTPQAFFQAYKDVLKNLKHFLFGKLLYRTNDTGDFEIAMPILPHEKFWLEAERGRGTDKKITYEFDYHHINIFLKNRGFGIFKLNNEKEKTSIWRFIQEDGRVLREVDHLDIREYIKDFMYDFGDIDLIRMINKGVEQYIGPSKLHNMLQRKPEIIRAQPNFQFLFFKNKCWKISAEKIEEFDYDQLPGYVWETNIIKDHSPVLLDKPLFTVEDLNADNPDEGVKWKVHETEELKKSEWYKYILNTSNFFWRKGQEEVELKDGRKSFQHKSEEAYKKNPLKKDEIQEIINAVVSKILATGYIVTEYKDLSNMKAVIAMDSVESEVGQSKGRTGKSIFVTQFEHIHRCEIIDGKKPRLTEDPHIYGSIDERHKVIMFDDCRIGLDFEFFFSQITSGITVNPKGKDSYKLPPPRFIFSTNHAINGNDDSSIARQFNVIFSDYYNPFRSPNDEFGHQLFREWDADQWSLYFNFVAASIQTFFKFQNLSKYGVQSMAIQKRNLRQYMGEAFLDWASLCYDDDGKYINAKVQKELLYEEYLSHSPRDRKWMRMNDFKSKLKAFCDYKNYLFNPKPFGKARDGKMEEAGGRYTAGGLEYYIVCRDDYDATSVMENKIDHTTKNS